ncbi:MAG: hypothetical protein ACI9R3_001609 [Verrucomicrobiales bacterium]|jgi:hypothetical protein
MTFWIGTLLIILFNIGLLFWLRGRLRRTHTTVRELQKQIQSLNKSFKRSSERTQRDLGSLRTEVKVTKYDYDSDGLRVWGKSVAFLEDEKFMSAYRKGIFSGQRLAGGELDVDLHIEWRIHVSCWAARHAAQLDGDFVECGVNTGIFSIAVCEYVDFNRTGKKFYLFDTYEGFLLNRSMLQRKP